MITINIINENSEMERIIKRKSNNDNSLSKEETSRQNKTKKTKKTITETSDYFSKIIQNQSNISLGNKYLTFMETYYYNIIFEKNEDIQKGIFCISGKLFNMLYKSKERKGVKKFMEKYLNKVKYFLICHPLIKVY